MKKYTIAYTTKTMSDIHEGTIEAKLRIAAEQASATEKAAADNVAAAKASKAQSLADRNKNAQAAAAERKAAKKEAIRQRFAAMKAANKAAEAERAAARATRKPAVPTPTKKATPSEINTLGERIVALSERREELNELLEQATEARNNGADNLSEIMTLAQKRSSVMVDIALLRNMLSNIAKDYADDEAMLTLIRAAKSGKAYEQTNKDEKTTKVNLMRYRAAVIKPQNVFDANVLRAINALHGLDINGKHKPIKKGECSKEYHVRIKTEACRALAYLEEVFNKKIAFPVMKAEELETRTFAQSLTSEIVGINDRNLQDKLVVIDHNLWQMFNVLDAKELFPCKLDLATGEELDGAQRIERLVKGYIERFENEGFTVSFGKNEHHYESWCYSNSGLKKGVGMLMDSETKRIHRDALYLGLDELPDTNGQEQYKIAALFNTPSKIWERTWTDDQKREHRQRIHLRDFIMMKAIKIKIPLTKGAIIVGKGEDVTVTVNTVNGKRDVVLPITIDPRGFITVEIDGWDGLILVNIKDFKPCQCRLAGSMKMLAIGVHGLLDKLIAAKPEYAAYADKDIYIEDIDGNMQLWREGSVLTTDTTWKAKKWFQKSWSKYLSNVEKLAETYDGFDCLRVVSNADAIDEMETTRHTSRQLMSQLFNMTADDAHLLLEGSAKKAAKLATVSGAVYKLAGLGKAEDTVTQFEHLFRVKPWLVGQTKIKTAMMVKMYDQLATLASANFVSEEVTLFMAQDVAAMLEVALLGASVDKADLGLLKAREFSTPGLRDGKKGVLVRYPSNGLNGTVMTNRKIDMFDTCGNVIMLNIHDPWIVDNDGDCDGDHAAAYLNQWLVRMFEDMENIATSLGLNKTVIFEHGDGAESRPATAEWMAAGRVEAVFNGMAFNYVGRFSNSAMFAWTMCSKAYNAGNNEEAYRWGMLANLFQVGAILTIDWCKTGVPAVGTPSRRIFEVALDLLDLQGEYVNRHAFAYKPWAQMFRDHEPGCCFVTKSKPVERMSAKGNKYLKHSYAQPSDAAIDTIAMAVMNEAGMCVDINGVITKAKFEDTPDFNIVKELGIEPATIMVDGKMVAAKNAQNGIIRSKLLHRINPNRFNANTLDGAEDREIATAIANNEPVSVVRFTQFCFRMLAELERGFAAEATNAATEMAAAETKELVYKATRSMLHSMLDDTAWSYKPGIIDPATGKTNGQMILDDIVDQDRKWQIVVDTVMRDAFEIDHQNRFSRDDENLENAARVKARYAMFVLHVFAPDLLNRVEKADGVTYRKADLGFIEVEEVSTRIGDLEDEDMLLVDEASYEMLYE